jgi:hypothetical protein
MSEIAPSLTILFDICVALSENIVTALAPLTVARKLDYC